MDRIYLDHAATTPVHPEVMDAMAPYDAQKFGNPSSLYAEGRRARDGIETARERVAEFINARPDEIVFTSGGTEADNLALLGAAWACRDRKNHVIISQIEHPAVLESAQWLESSGFRVSRLTVDDVGIVNLEELEKIVTSDSVCLVSLMLANDEVGTLEPLDRVVPFAHENDVLVHTDAVQAAGQIPLDVKHLGVDLLSLSAHKIYGPKGVGVLYVRQGTVLSSWMLGGVQERGRRAGTENVAGIVGLGKACELAKRCLFEESIRLSALRDQLLDGLLQALPDCYLNGSPDLRLPNNVNLGIKGVSSDSLIINLDLSGVAASSGSACSSGALKPSHVLKAMGVPEEHASLRLTLGRENTADQIDEATRIIAEVVERLRNTVTGHHGGTEITEKSL